jgi:hypothetical protein
MILQSFFSHNAIDHQLGSNVLLFLGQDRHNLARGQIGITGIIDGVNHFLTVICATPPILRTPAIQWGRLHPLRSAST